MGKLAQTVETRSAVRIDPKLRKQLLAHLQQYARLKTQSDALKVAMDKLKGECGSIRDEIGEVSVKLEGFTVSLVAPTKSKFNPKKFVANGGDMDIYNQSIDIVPVKSYEKISVPGAVAHEE